MPCDHSIRQQSRKKTVKCQRKSQMAYNSESHQLSQFHTLHPDALVLTFGAKLKILPHPFILKSALTTPPILVPNISRLLFNNTAALSSNLTTRPSGLLTDFLVRTITALRTSPRRTFIAVAERDADAGMGRARLTTQTISSPTEPQPFVTLFLRTLTHSTMSAPELSMHWVVRPGLGC